MIWTVYKETDHLPSSCDIKILAPFYFPNIRVLLSSLPTKVKTAILFFFLSLGSLMAVYEVVC